MKNNLRIEEILQKLSKNKELKKIYANGQKLFKQGAVQILSQGNDFYETEVEDNNGSAEVWFDFQENPSGSCTCKESGWCIHKIASLFEINDTQAEQVDSEGRKYTKKGMIKRVLNERQEKAKTANYKVLYAKNGYGEHVLSNEKGSKYKITFRDFEANNGYCSCSDYATNKLGTCKHLLFAFEDAKNSKKQPNTKFPFVDIYLNPLNDYKVSYFYPEQLPETVKSLIQRFFKDKNYLEDSQLIAFLPFIREAQNDKFILIRPEVLNRVETAFDENILLQKSLETQLDFAVIKTALFPYQKEGITFATFKKGAIIADEMGLGKTVQAIGTAVFKKEIFGFKKTLIICPASLKAQWKNEIEKFTVEKVAIIEGGFEERKKTYKNTEAYFYIINYETVLRDRLLLNDCNFDFIILDEAQRIKNFETITASAIKSLKRNHSLILTGTPIENKLIDVFSIVGFSSSNLLTPLWEFSYQHCYFDKSNNNKITGYFNLQQLKERLKSVLIRREKKDVIQQLTNITMLDVAVDFHPLQQEYHANFANAIASILRKKFKTPYDMQILTMNLQSMRMVCDSTFLIDKETHHSPKLVELEEVVLQKLDLPNNSRKIIIFSEWINMNAIIGKMLKENGIVYVELNGKMPVQKREEVIKEFEENPKCQVFLSTEAGGAGLNLQVADTVINFELPWNPAKKNQRIGRIDRLGQKNTNLTVINLITRGSIEMKIASGLAVKQNLFESVLNEDSTMDMVDFSEKGRSQFLQQLEMAMSEFTQIPLETENITEIDPSEQVQLNLSDDEDDRIETKQKEQIKKLEELEAVMNKGMDFLSGLFKMSTGKELSSSGNRIEVDRETGEVIMRFKIDF